MSDCSAEIAKGQAPSPECLGRAAQHVAHDLELFQLAWAERQSRLGWTLWFILARSLWDFFFTFERRKRDGLFLDDILASDFPATHPWRDLAESLRKAAEQLPDSGAVRNAANKYSAHLTYSRIDAPTAEPSESIHRFLTGVASTWRDRLKPEAKVWLG